MEKDLEIIDLAFIFQMDKFGQDFQKIYSKMYLVSCTNTHRDVTDSVNYGMVKNTKT